ncbi:unnamed protein product [Phytophthora lilii]|uniref:Unnamed protein product n=1 Tax=Phytophthora lilii TaxID=2077276 RepID=A0A9W6U3C5_9STRA|nr:unnamed protein product [Phytophthora lilii]
MNQEFDFTGSDEDQQSRDNNEPWVEQGGENSDEEFATDKRAYTPQLMDTQEMQALRAALIRSEAQIQEQGHMKEYVPHKHVSSRLRRWYGLPRNHLVVNRPVMSAGPLPRFDSSFSATKYHERPMTSMKPAPAGVKTTEFAKMLKEEARQVRGK